MKRARTVALAAADISVAPVSAGADRGGCVTSVDDTSDAGHEGDSECRRESDEKIDDPNDGGGGDGDNSSKLRLEDRVNFLRQCEGAWTADQERRLRHELPTELLREALLTCGRTPIHQHRRPSEHRLRLEADAAQLRRLMRVVGSIFPHVERPRPVGRHFPTAIWLHVLTWCAAHDMGRVALVSRAFRLATCTSDAWHSVAVQAPLELNLRRFVRSFPTVLARARSVAVEGAESRHAIMEAFELVARAADAPPPDEVRGTQHDDEEEDADPRGTAPTECMAQPFVGVANRCVQSFAISDSYFHMHAVHMLAREFAARLCVALPNLRRLEIRLTRIRWTSASVQAMLDQLPLLRVLVRFETPSDTPIGVPERMPIVLPPSLVEYRDDSQAVASLPVAFAPSPSPWSTPSTTGARASEFGSRSLEVLKHSASTAHSDFSALASAARLHTLWHQSEPYARSTATTDETDARLRLVALHPTLTELRVTQDSRPLRNVPRADHDGGDGGDRLRIHPSGSPTDVADQSDSSARDDEFPCDWPTNLWRPLMRRLVVFSSAVPYFDFPYIHAYSHLCDVRFAHSDTREASVRNVMRVLCRCAAFRRGRLVYVQFPRTHERMFLPSPLPAASASADTDANTSRPAAAAAAVAEIDVGPTPTTAPPAAPKNGDKARVPDDDDVFDFANTQVFAWSGTFDSLMLVPQDLIGDGGGDADCARDDAELHVQIPFVKSQQYYRRRYPVAIADPDLAHLLARRRRHVRGHGRPRRRSTDSKEGVAVSEDEPDSKRRTAADDEWPPCVVAFSTADRNLDTPKPRVAAPQRECPFRCATVAERHCYCAAPAAEWRPVDGSRWVPQLSDTPSASHRSSPLGTCTVTASPAVSSNKLISLY